MQTKIERTEKMDLNKIILTDDQKELLFRNHLYQLDGVVSDETPHPLAVKGDMNKGILWIIHDENYPYLNETDTGLLHKILNACKLTPEQIGLVNCFGSELSTETISTKLNAKMLILSGLPESSDKTLTTPFYEICEWNNIRMIRTDSLETIGKDQSLKTRLWNSLRQLFNL
jgi:hypothetical protein